MAGCGKNPERRFKSGIFALEENHPLYTSGNKSLEEIALRIYGSADSPAYRRWISYWKASRERNEELFRKFEEIVLLETEGSRILDIGCGTGGLGNLVGSRCRHYVGGDFNRHVLQFCPHGENLSFVQCSGIELPFPDNHFDLVIAFDVAEHLVGGRSWQERFFQELGRILAPCGMILLTTPNFWYPYDAHTELYFPQYLPTPLRDPYIRKLNPEFFKEHGSFREIRLVRPGTLKRLIDRSGLAPMHDLPCCLDRDEYLWLHPLLGRAASVGLGWLFHAEFWLILVHRSERILLRKKLRKNWYYEQNQPSKALINRFHDRVDFRHGPFNHQLGNGWHWYEEAGGGFRWTSRRAELFLESRGAVRYLTLEGFCPEENDLRVFADGTWIGDQPVAAGEIFKLRFLLPFPVNGRRLFSIALETGRVMQSKNPEDKRELGVMMFSLALTP